MNKHVKRKIFYNNNGFPKGFSVKKETNAWFLRYKGNPRARFFFPVTLEMVRKYASAYAKCIKEFKLKV